MKASYALSKHNLHTDFLNSYAVKNTSGVIYVNKGNICFANISKDTSNLPITEFCLSIQQIFRGNWKVPNIPKYKKYLLFLLNDSVFSHCFLTKRWQDAVKYGVSVNCSQPANQVWAALTAVRCGWEYFYAYAGFWNELVDRGVSPNLAFMMSGWVKTYSDDKGYLYSQPVRTGHSVWGFTSFAEMRMILNGELKVLSNHMNMIEPCCCYVQDTTYWNTGNGQQDYEILLKHTYKNKNKGYQYIMYNLDTLSEYLIQWEKQNAA